MVKKSRILILTGPSGCGKNSLIKTYAQSENIVVKYFIDIKSSYVEDLGKVDDANTFIPDDHLGLLRFINEI